MPAPAGLGLCAAATRPERCRGAQTALFGTIERNKSDIILPIFTDKTKKIAQTGTNRQKMATKCPDFATLCQPIPQQGRRPGSVASPLGMRTMDAAVNRRLTVAVSWALARRATLDTFEQFEESYALTEEFREWLLCLEEHPDLLEPSVLMVPNTLRPSNPANQPGPGASDGLLEI